MTIVFHAFYFKKLCFLVIFMKSRLIFIDIDSKPMTLLRHTNDFDFSQACSRSA